MLGHLGSLGRLGASGRGGAPVGPDTTVASAWSGAITDTTFTAAHYLGADTSGTRLVVSTASDLSAPVFSNRVNSNAKTVKHTISGLNPDTAYYFGVEIAGTIKSDKKGKFRTLPAVNSPVNFRFGVMNCQSGNNNGSVLTTLRGLTPPLNFAQHIGDLHYADISTNSESLFDAAYEGILGGTYSGPFLREVATFYMWDDHDYGPNDSDSTSPSRQASIATYKRRVPSPALPLANGVTDPIAYSYVVGRVRFIVPDCRSQRTASTMLGATQKQWLFDEFDAAAAAGQFVFLFTSITWQYEWGVPGGLRTAMIQERAEIADYIRSVGLGRRTMIFGGDAHAGMYDNGVFRDFSNHGGAPIPEVHSGGLYTGGASVVFGSFWSDGITLHSPTIQEMANVVDVTDDGTSLSVQVNTYGGLTDPISVIKTFNASFPSTPPVTPAKVVQQAYFESNDIGAWAPTLDQPATAGNLLILIIALRGGLPFSGYTTTGWTTVGGMNNNNISIYAYRRVAVGGETTLGVTSSIGARAVVVGLIEIETTSASSPVDVFVTDDQSGAVVGGLSGLTGTSTLDNEIAIAVAGMNVGKFTQGTAPSWSDGFIQQRWSPQNFPGFSLAMKQLGVAGAASPAFNMGGDTTYMAGLLLTIKP
jgi:hypothetical protein